jgi:hypothetical protein
MLAADGVRRNLAAAETAVINGLVRGAAFRTGEVLGTAFFVVLLKLQQQQAAAHAGGCARLG